MAEVHGRNTVIIINGNDLSTYGNTSQMSRGAKTHETTTYGKDDETWSGGIRNGKFTFGGIYDNAVGGPRAVLDPLVKETVSVIRRTEGTGAGRPQQSFSGVLENYVETNPVSDMIAWSAEVKVSGPVTPTTQ